jgi:hypothetical protein
VRSVSLFVFLLRLLPHTFNVIGTSASDRVNEVISVIYCKMLVSLRAKRIVSSPKIRNNCSSWRDMLLNNQSGYLIALSSVSVSLKRSLYLKQVRSGKATGTTGTAIAECLKAQIYRQVHLIDRWVSFYEHEHEFTCTKTKTSIIEVGLGKLHKCLCVCVCVNVNVCDALTPFGYLPLQVMNPSIHTTFVWSCCNCIVTQ